MPNKAPLFSTRTAKSKLVGTSSVASLREARAARLKKKQERAKRAAAVVTCQSFLRATLCRRRVFAKVDGELRAKLGDLAKICALLRKAKPGFCFPLEKLAEIVVRRNFLWAKARYLQDVNLDTQFYEMVLPSFLAENPGLDYAPVISAVTPAEPDADTKQRLPSMLDIAAFRLARIVSQCIESVVSKADSTANAYTGPAFRILSACLDGQANTIGEAGDRRVARLWRTVRTTVCSSSVLREHLVRQIMGFQEYVAAHVHDCERNIPTPTSRTSVPASSAETGGRVQEPVIERSSDHYQRLSNFPDLATATLWARRLVKLSLKLVVAELQQSAAMDLQKSPCSTEHVDGPPFVPLTRPTPFTNAFLAVPHIDRTIRPLVEDFGESCSDNHFFLKLLAIDIQPFAETERQLRSLGNPTGRHTRFSAVALVLEESLLKTVLLRHRVSSETQCAVSNWVALLLVGATIAAAQVGLTASQTTSRLRRLRLLLLQRGCMRYMGEQWSAAEKDFAHVLALSQAISSHQRSGVLHVDHLQAACPVRCFEGFEYQTAIALVQLLRAESSMRSAGPTPSAANADVFAQHVVVCDINAVQNLAHQLSQARDYLVAAQPRIKRRKTPKGAPHSIKDAIKAAETQAWFRLRHLLDELDQRFIVLRRRQRSITKELARLDRKKGHDIHNQENSPPGCKGVDDEPVTESATRQWVQAVRQDISALAVLSREAPLDKTGRSAVSRDTRRMRKRIARREKKKRRMQRRHQSASAVVEPTDDGNESKTPSQSGSTSSNSGGEACDACTSEAVSSPKQGVDAATSQLCSEAPETVAVKRGAQAEGHKSSSQPNSSMVPGQRHISRTAKGETGNIEAGFRRWLCRFGIKPRDAAHHDLLFSNWRVLTVSRQAADHSEGPDNNDLSNTTDSQKPMHDSTRSQTPIGNQEHPDDSSTTTSDGSVSSDDCKEDFAAEAQESTAKCSDDDEFVERRDIDRAETVHVSIGTADAHDDKADTQATQNDPSAGQQARVEYVLDAANIGYCYGRQHILSVPKEGQTRNRRHFASRGVALALERLNEGIAEGAKPKAVAILPQRFVASKYTNNLADDVELLQVLMSKKWLFLSPSYVDDDQFLIKFAAENKPRCQIVTNDNMLDHLRRLRTGTPRGQDQTRGRGKIAPNALDQSARDELADWLEQALVKFMFVGDTFVAMNGFF